MCRGVAPAQPLWLHMLQKNRMFTIINPSVIIQSTSETLRKQVNEEMRQRAALEVRRVQNTKALSKGKTGLSHISIVYVLLYGSKEEK